MTTEFVEDETPRQTRKSRESEKTWEIDLSKHPYHRQHKISRKYPSLLKVRNLDEFRKALNHEEDGPKWYETLAKAFEYDHLLYDQCFANQKKAEEYKKITLELAKDKTMNEQTIENLEEELAHLRIANAELVQRTEDAQRREREATVSVPPSIAIVPSSSSHRPRGINPSESLTGIEPKEYNAWVYSIREKLDTDSPKYANDRQRVRYALSQMKDPIFDAMHAWVTDVGGALTLESFFLEIENYMGLHHQAKDAKKELLTIKMENNENVSGYYHRIFKLWQNAKTPMEDRIETFLTTMKPGISSSLIGKEYTDFKELLETARRIEARRKDVAHTFPRDSKLDKTSNSNSSKNQNRVNSNSAQISASVKPNLAQHDSPRDFEKQSNRQFGPVNKKPNGWVGSWFDGEQFPPKLQPEDKEQLIKQGRCWSYRGSGHRGSDSICINFERRRKVNKINKGILESIESESDTASDSGKE